MSKIAGPGRSERRDCRLLYSVSFGSSGEDDKKYKRRVWNVFIHAQNHTNHTKNRDFTTFDLYPTILASLGYKVDRAGLGTNLFSSEKTITERMNAKTFNKELTKKSDFYRSLL